MSLTEWRIQLSLVALAVIPYANALRAGFVFDDLAMVVENPMVQSAALPTAAVFSRPYEPGSLYRPLVFLSFWLNERLAPGESWAFHATNLGFHAAATLLAYRLARVLLSDRAAAFLAATLFAVHPVHTEAVTGIAGRSEPMAAIGVLASLLCLHRSFASVVPRRWRAVAALFYVFGLLCKESAFVCIPLAALLRWHVRGDNPLALLRRPQGAPELLALLLAGAAYLALRFCLLGSLTLPVAPSWLDNPLAHTNAPVRIATAAVVLADYVRLLVLPLSLSADYSYDAVPLVFHPGDARLPAALSLASSCALLAWSVRPRVPAVATGLLFFLLAFAITANIFFPIGTIKAERLLYLPSFGFFLAAAALARGLLLPERKVGIAVCSAVLLALALRTWVRNEDWQSNLALFEATVEAAPRSAKAHHNLAVALHHAGRRAEASLEFRRALALYPEYEEAAFGIGRMYEERGILEGARHWYEKALALNPRFNVARLNLATVLYNSGRYAEAEKQFAEALAREPENPRLLAGLGLARLALGDTSAARQLLERAARLDAENPEIRAALEFARRAARRETHL